MPNNKSSLFILGAGASVDSGLPTYRGINGLYNNSFDYYEQMLTKTTNSNKLWEILEPLFNQIYNTKDIGETYKLLETLINNKYPNSMIATQNIDGFAKNICVPLVELHGNYSKIKCLDCDIFIDYVPGHICNQCGKHNTIPNIVLFEDNIDVNYITQIYNFMKLNKPKYVFIIGTTLQFKYLQDIICKAKMYGSECIHINPDKNYICDSDDILICDTSSNALNFLINK